MELLIKVGNKYTTGHSNFLTGWRDGQVVDIREDGFHKASSSRRSFCVVQTKEDFWTLRGSTDWKSTDKKVYDLKKFLCCADSNGKHRWEDGYIEDEESTRKRDWFVDFKDLLDKGVINQAQFDSVYNKSVDHLPIVLPLSAITDVCSHEDVKTRKTSVYSERVG